MLPMMHAANPREEVHAALANPAPPGMMPDMAVQRAGCAAKARLCTSGESCQPAADVPDTCLAYQLLLQVG